MGDEPPARGAERFDRYVERCLYGADGFYSVHGQAGGRNGDFITSPEVGPLFGAVVAQAIDGWWEELGRPDPLVVYDVGCGPGRLLRSIAAAKPDRPWKLIGVDIAGAGADIAALPSRLDGAIVLANELLDNLPFRVVEHTEAGLHEIYVTDGREERRPVELDVDIPIGCRAPYVELAARFVTDVLERRPARLCLFDYGAPTTSELARRGGWIRTYRQHERGDDPLFEPGRWDITCDVPWDQLPPPTDGLERQADVLRRWGIDDLVTEGRDHWAANAHAPDVAALRMRSRIGEAEALLDPNGLGRWLVGLWSI